MSRDLFKMALSRRMSNCLIGGRPCGFLFQYEGSNFCVSEILGEGCQVEKLEQMEQLYDEKEKVNFSLPFQQEMESELLLPRTRAAEFKVYHRDHLTHSAVFLGKIIGRRRKERGDNLKGLLNKAIKEYSGHVEDPSTIFLLEQ
jgi:hypothetical protein